MTYSDFKYIRAYIRQRNYERWQMIKDKLCRIFLKRKAINSEMLHMASEFWHECRCELKEYDKYDTAI